MATSQKTASWGVTETSAGVTGVITDIEFAVESVTAPEENEVGSVINQTMYDVHKTANATVQVAAGTAIPKAGQAITFGSETMYVTSARLVENNKSYRKIMIAAESFALCSAVENATGITSS